MVPNRADTAVYKTLTNVFVDVALSKVFLKLNSKH